MSGEVSETPMSEAGDMVLPETLCGKRGAMFDTATPTGRCVFTKDHGGKHSWQK